MYSTFKFTVFCFGMPVFSDCIHMLVEQFIGLVSQLQLVETDYRSPFATGDMSTFYVI